MNIWSFFYFFYVFKWFFYNSEHYRDIFCQLSPPTRPTARDKSKGPSSNTPTSRCQRQSLKDPREKATFDWKNRWLKLPPKENPITESCMVLPIFHTLIRINTPCCSHAKKRVEMERLQNTGHTGMFFLTVRSQICKKIAKTWNLSDLPSVILKKRLIPRVNQ